MSRSRSLSVLAAVVAMSLVPAAAVHGAVGRSSPSPAAVSRDRGQELMARELARADTVSGQFLGIDGLTYASAPYAVPGLRDELFFGADFDTACGIGGGYTKPMSDLGKLAKVIEKSGRRAIWIAGPSKPTVLTNRISTFPHGECDRVGLAQESHAVDSIKDPNFLPLRAALAKSKHQVYFKTDPHWTTVGAAIFVQQLARRLDPALAARQHYVYGTESRVGLLNLVLGNLTPETAETELPADHVRTRTAKHSVEDFTTYPDVVLDHSWVTSPARKTWPGRTLLLGDSFMLFALASMRPVFRHGRFMWVGHVDEDDVVKAIKHSDTVVLEILQTFVPLGSLMVSKEFRQRVKKALAKH